MCVVGTRGQGEGRLLVFDIDTNRTIYSSGLEAARYRTDMASRRASIGSGSRQTSLEYIGYVTRQSKGGS